MPHDIRVITVRDFLRADVSGQLDLPASKRLLEELASACVGNPERHILIDGREASGSQLSSVDLLELVNTLRRLGLGLLNRIAILRVPRENFDRARFFEMLAADRGYHVAAFDDFEEAFDWLNGGSQSPRQ